MSSPDPFQDLVNALRRTLTSAPAPPDTIGLEKFIQLSIRFAAVCSCASKSTKASDSSVSSPEPASYEMQIDKSRLPSAERQRRLTQGLCFYCGLHGHLRSECPTRPVRSMVSVILPTLNHQNPLTIIASLTAADVCIPVNAFIDSGSAGNFISGALSRQLNLHIHRKSSGKEIC
ncbi:hypothetical protein DPX16_23569 [Anabarilius grahami]|uniref:CCHC-type domain-containing protein n=1 Tax=Anabarilius grahami TaxID=495550 RepID=A0A3N0XQL9_ANAGA|nr:hypothetical protein DPX16_23569 [Anabarilius grahami]